MSGDNFDQVLFGMMSLPHPERIEASAQRCREIHAEHGDATGAWIISGTEFAYNRHVKVSQHRFALVAALDAIEQATTDARKALDELHSLIDRDLLPPHLGRSAVLQQAMATITLAVAGAKHHAPDPDAPETEG